MSGLIDQSTQDAEVRAAKVKMRIEVQLGANAIKLGKLMPVILTNILCYAGEGRWRR